MDILQNPAELYADDTKIFGRIRPALVDEDLQTIQSDLDKYMDIKKFKVFHAGKSNSQSNLLND